METIALPKSILLLTAILGLKMQNSDYNRHGSLKRIELGEWDVQGQDYAYTLQGWIKGINSNTMQKDRDMGRDGATSSLNPQ